MGHQASAAGIGSTAVGENAIISNSSADAVALGHDAAIFNSPGGIAIGADLNNNNVGATATAPSAIAIGADSQANAVSSIILGVNGVVSGENSTAVGTNVVVSGENSTAVGTNVVVNGNNAAAMGAGASATTLSTAMGAGSAATGTFSSAYGYISKAESEKSTSLGYATGFNGGVANTDSPGSVAIGYFATIKPASPGAIAIGGSDGPADLVTRGAEVTGENAIAIGFEAKATQPGAIAIGADVVADIPNTLVTNVPILARDPDTMVVPRTMFEISGFGNTKFTVTNADKNEQWAFANPGTGFRLSRQGSGSVELEIKNNGNAVLAGTLSENSDRNNKQDIQPLDQQAILDKVMALPINQWRYKDDPQSKHIGPMAQDFYKAFELGHTDKGISTLDSSGVALAAIQALEQKNVEKDRKITELRIEKDKEIAGLKNQNKALSERMQKMEDQLTEIDTLKQQLASILVKAGGVQLTQALSE